MVTRTLTTIGTAALIAAAMLSRQADQAKVHSLSDDQGSTIDSVTPPPATISSSRLIGAAPDAHVRSFLNNNGLPE